MQSKLIPFFFRQFNALIETSKIVHKMTRGLAKPHEIVYFFKASLFRGASVYSGFFSYCELDAYWRQDKNTF